MNRSRFVVVGVLSALAAIGIISSTGSAQVANRTISGVETSKGSFFNYVDNPPRSKDGASVGDELTFGNKLVANGQTLGRFDVNCVILRNNRSRDKAPFMCHGIAVLSDGTIDVSAVIKPPHPILGSINGGTGAYESAGGHFTSASNDKNQFVDTFTVIP
jgi:hypothetical protein